MSKYTDYAKAFNASDEVIFWITHNLPNYLKTNPEVQDDIEHIIDYLISEDSPKRLKSMSYDEAKANTDKWTKTQQKKGQQIKETLEDTEVVLDFKDGFKIVKLIGENAYKREGYLMSHCVASYYAKDVEVYSLRDKDNMPHATMEKDQQIKGKGNGNIHPKYVEYVVKFLEHVGMTVGDNEMKHLGYINMSKFKKDLHKDTKYFNKVYLPKTEKLIDKKGLPYASLDLWDILPLVSDEENTLKINFELPTFIKLSIERIKKVKTNKGDGGISSGYYSTNASSGNSSTNASSGHSSTNEMIGNYSVSVSAGADSQAKGKIGCWFCLSEWKIDPKDNINKPICVKAVQIDGKKIKEDTWYKLENGEFVEVNNKGDM